MDAPRGPNHPAARPSRLVRLLHGTGVASVHPVELLYRSYGLGT